jgi:hypothetical protein
MKIINDQKSRELKASKRLMTKHSEAVLLGSNHTKRVFNQQLQTRHGFYCFITIKRPTNISLG